MSELVLKATNRIKEKIEKHELDLEFLKKFENGPIKVTEDEWYSLCDTPIGSLFLIEVAKKTFPFAKDFNFEINNITFKINDFKIILSTTRYKVIKIDISVLDNLKCMKDIDVIYSERYTRMKKTYSIIDNKELSYNEKMNNLGLTDNIVSKTIKYTRLLKKLERDREKWASEFKKEEEYNKQTIESKEKAKKEFEILYSSYLEVVDYLEKWSSNVKAYYRDDYGIWATNKAIEYK